MLRSLLVIAAIMSLFVLVFPRLQPQAPGIDVAETAHQVEQSTQRPAPGLPEAQCRCGRTITALRT